MADIELNLVELEELEGAARMADETRMMRLMIYRDAREWGFASAVAGEMAKKAPDARRVGAEEGGGPAQGRRAR